MVGIDDLIHVRLGRQQNVAWNPVQTYKDAMNNVTGFYKSLGPLNVLCVPWGALHFPEEGEVNNLTHLEVAAYKENQ